MSPFFQKIRSSLTSSLGIKTKVATPDSHNKKKRRPTDVGISVVIHFLKRWILWIEKRIFWHSPSLSNQSNITFDVTLPEKRFDPPVGSRWAISNNTTNLSGKWRPIITPAFKRKYEKYLLNCSQPLLFHNLCLNFVALTREEIKQQGNALRIKGTNPIGVWNQTLISSGTDHYNEDYEPINSTFLDPDGEMVHVESWWENNGTVHKSWLRGKPRCCGGEFESTRYLQDENSLVCESVFHPNAAGAPKSKGFLPATVTWRFRPE